MICLCLFPHRWDIFLSMFWDGITETGIGDDENHQTFLLVVEGELASLWQLEFYPFF